MKKFFLLQINRGVVCVGHRWVSCARWRRMLCYVTTGRGRRKQTMNHPHTVKAKAGAALEDIQSRLTQQNCKVILLLCSVLGSLWTTCFANRAFH